MTEHSVIYSHRDESGDRLRVECWPETIGVDAEDASDGERVSVILPRVEGIRLARAILAALDAEPDAEPEPGLTHQVLYGMPDRSEVYDQDGEKWIKYGTEWKYYAGDLYQSSVDLIDHYGPITAKDGVGSSRHADKTETGDTP